MMQRKQPNSVVRDKPYFQWTSSPTLRIQSLSQLYAKRHQSALTQRESWRGRKAYPLPSVWSTLAIVGKLESMTLRKHQSSIQGANEYVRTVQLERKNRNKENSPCRSRRTWHRYTNWKQHPSTLAWKKRHIHLCVSTLIYCQYWNSWVEREKSTHLRREVICSRSQSSLSVSQLLASLVKVQPIHPSICSFVQTVNPHHQTIAQIQEWREQKKVELTFSSKTKQLNKAAHCWGVKSLKTPPKIISVNNNSSPELISQATLPFCSTTSSFVANPNRLKARLRFRSSSRCMTEWAAWIFFFVVRILSLRDSFAEYWS